MPRVEVNGLSLAYDLIGDGEKAITITPGGRFSRDTPGVRQLAEELAGHGYKVLIWDRPNCGESDIAFAGEGESFQNADALAGMIRALGLGKPLVYGASGGSREAMLLAIRHPDCVSGLFLQWPTGGGLGIATLPISYYAGSVTAASFGGMEAVVELPDWAEQIARNPGNRDRLLAFDTQEFIQKMLDWSDALINKPGMPIACIEPGDLESIKVPTVMLRSGKSDIHHARATSEKVASMIPGAELQEPPWGDREWLDRMQANGQDQSGLFKSMPMLVPQILALAKSYGHV